MAITNTAEPTPPTSLPHHVSNMQFGGISLVLGIVSLPISNATLSLSIQPYLSGIVLFFVGPLLTIVFGHLGRRTGQKQRGAAVAGLILGYLQLIVVIGGLMLLLLFSGVN